MSDGGFERLAVVGAGLLGGSVALAAQARGVAKQIRVVDPSLAPDVPFERSTLPEVARWADIIALAVPIEAMDAVMQELGPHLGADVLVTDTASVKAPVAESARRWLPRPDLCVGAHPMAGGDRTGFAHASAELFEGAACILALRGSEPPEAVDRVEQFWQGLGTHTARRTPDEHDAIVAGLSHAPHVIAFAFAQGLPDAETLRLAGPGLRDFTRIARSNPTLWCEILLRNRSRVAEEAARFRENFDRLIGALTEGDRPGILEALRAGRCAVEKL